jgi:hypothetical protein
MSILSSLLIRLTGGDKNETNFGLIARSITSYHEGLRKYENKFPDYKTLVMVAGFLDATVYIKNNEIDVTSIMEIAQSVVDKYKINDFDFSSNESIRIDLLSHFVMGMQFIEFTVDIPQLSSGDIMSAIETSCMETHESVKKTFLNYKIGKRDKGYDLGAKNWMNSPNTSEIRNCLGIK